MFKKYCDKIRSFYLWFSEKTIAMPNKALDVAILIIMILLFLILIKI